MARPCFESEPVAGEMRNEMTVAGPLYDPNFERTPG